MRTCIILTLVSFCNISSFSVSDLNVDIRGYIGNAKNPRNPPPPKVQVSFLVMCYKINDVRF